MPPLPLLLVSGATTTTLVFFCVRSASTSVSMPGAPTPSSLVTSTVMVAGFLAFAADAGVAAAHRSRCECGQDEPWPEMLNGCDA